MPADPKAPLSVTLCNGLVRLIAKSVPFAQRKDWEQEWLAEIWHRWQFLLHAGAWNRGEAIRLMRNCVGAIPDALWHLAAQETVQSRVRNCARSPWTCLGGVAALLLLVAFLSSGFPATRQLLGFGSARGDSDLLFIWLHPAMGSSDRGLPSDVTPAWASHSQLLKTVAPFNISRAQLASPQTKAASPLVITTEPALFTLLNAHPLAGNLPQTSAVVLDNYAWVSRFGSDPKIVGSTVRIGRENYRVAAVLPASFHFLTRRPLLFLVQPRMLDARVMIVARAKPGVDAGKIDKELTKIAQDSCYYFFNSQLRFSFLKSAILTPLGFFVVAALASAILSIMMCRVRAQHIRSALKPENRRVTVRRASFFLGKVILGLLLVFTAGLEATRSQSAILFASKDPANGPVLVWFYIIGTMAVIFGAVADQRSRCRVCLRLLCFPVRIGCPGCLLLDWSGTELLCTEGHGVLHVPHLAPSWEEAEHWIALDDSWRSLFAGTK